MTQRLTVPDVSLRAELRAWCELWSVPGLEARVRITTSARFHRALGTFCAQRNEIRLPRLLVATGGPLLDEVLCHELAHAAVAAMRRRARPHGGEWRALMRSAGFEPRVRIPVEEARRAGLHVPRAGRGWLHQCPVCRASRVAARPVRTWRCAACRADGLDGALDITRIDARR